MSKHNSKSMHMGRKFKTCYRNNHQNGEEVIINLFWKYATFDIRNYPFHQFN